MPLPMVHLNVAVKIKTICDKKEPEFYLGSISPDAVHMRAGFVSEDKKRSHGNARSISEISELEDLCQLIYESDGKYRSFLLGYLIHIITDLIWRDSVLKTYEEHYDADTCPEQDKKMGYYNDTDQLDFVIYEKSSWRQDVWKKLETSEEFGVSDIITKEEVAAWKDRTLNWYNSGKSMHTYPVKYLCVEELDEFAEAAARECEQYLREHGLV